MRRLRNGVFLVTLISVMLFGAELVSAAPDSGTLVVFMAGQEVGYEEFTLDAQGLASAGSIEVSGQRVVTETSLQGSPGMWKTYELSTSGVKLSGQFAG